jgi:hypothetical protein
MGLLLYAALYGSLLSRILNRGSSISNRLRKSRRA